MNQIEFMQLIAPFKEKLFRLARRLLISIEEAEDAVQEVIIKLWTKQKELHEYESVEAIAMTMTKNYCLDILKSRRAGNLKIIHNNFSDREVGVQQKMEDRDNLIWVEKIIDQLPTQQKLIIQMREIEQYEFAEIARILEMEEIAIRVALSRARKTIREFMNKTHSYGIA